MEKKTLKQKSLEEIRYRIRFGYLELLSTDNSNPKCKKIFTDYEKQEGFVKIMLGITPKDVITMSMKKLKREKEPTSLIVLRGS